EVTAAFPEFFEDPDAYGRQVIGRGDLQGYSRDILTSIVVEGGLSGIRIEIPKEVALSVLEAKWGAPQTLTLGRQEVSLWADESTGIRAILEPSFSDDALELEVQPFITYAAIAGGAGMTFLPEAVLGKTAADLLATFPAYVSMREGGSKAADKLTRSLEEDLKRDGMELGARVSMDLEVTLPPTRYDADSTLVVLHFDEDKRVRSYTAMVEYSGRKETRQELMAAFTAAWGAPRMLKKVLGEQPFWYDAEKGLRVSARFRGDEVDLEFTRYTPLAALFGPGKDAWGFEIRPILGATPQELTDAWGSACRIKDDKKFGSLTLEKTDYQDNVGNTLIHLVFDDAQKVASFSFSLRYRDFPAARAEISALLETKYGKPVPAPDDFLKRQRYSQSPKVLVRDSDITHALDITVETVAPTPVPALK
ncbi:MAG: hypothetical protein ACI9WU_004520, partial [Myxococcota bacterium]